MLFAPPKMLMMTTLRSLIRLIEATYSDEEIDACITNAGIYFLVLKRLIKFSEMTEVGILEKSVETAEHIEIGYDGKRFLYRLRSVTGKYKDIFEVTRFMMRCQKDARIRQAKKTKPNAQ